MGSHSGIIIGHFLGVVNLVSGTQSFY